MSLAVRLPAQSAVALDWNNSIGEARRAFLRAELIEMQVCHDANADRAVYAGNNDRPFAGPS